MTFFSVTLASHSSQLLLIFYFVNTNTGPEFSSSYSQIDGIWDNTLDYKNLMSTTVLCCRPHLLLFLPTTLWTGYLFFPHHCYRALLKMRKVTWLNSHLYNLELSLASPDTEEVSSTLCSDKVMYEHGYLFGRRVRVLVRNISVAVMFTLYHHEFIDRSEKWTEASRKQPLGWIICRGTRMPTYSSQETSWPWLQRYQWRRKPFNTSPIFFSSSDTITLTSQLINYREPWSSISKNVIKECPKTLGPLSCPCIVCMWEMVQHTPWNGQHIL